MLEANAFDTICHEHLEYYAFRQIRSLLESHGLRVVSTQYNASNGGSARIVACHRRARYVTDTASVAAAEARERSLGVDQIGTYHRFAERAHATRRDLRQLLDRALADGQRIHVYGASTKGNTLLQFCGIDDSVVEAASERNPQKWGRRTPGTNIPIISEAESRSSAPEYLLVLPWHFRDEFVVREAPYIASGGKLIFPLPTLSVYPA